MNIIQVQDDLKNFSEQQLIDEMQSPSGMAPQFLVLSELTRRRRVKEDFNARQAEQQPTVAQEAIAAAGMPQEIMPQMAESLAPKSASALSGSVGTSMPMNMRSGGLMSFGREISGKISEDVGPFLDEVENMAESKFNIELDDARNPFGPMRTLPAEPIALDRINFEPAVMKPMEETQPAPTAFAPTGLGRLSRFGGKGRSDAIPYNQGGLLGGYDEDMDFSNMSMEEMLEFMKRMKGLSSPMKMQEGGTLGIRQNNPGNIRPGAKFFGETGIGSGYATFANPIYGGRALARLMSTYKKDHGISNVSSFIDRYAPSGDNTPASRKNYKSFLAGKLGIGEDTEIDLDDDNTKMSLMKGIVEFENKKQNPFTDQDYNLMIQSAKIDDESEVDKLIGTNTSSLPSDGGLGLISQAVAGPPNMQVQDEKKDDEGILSKILTTKIPFSEYIDPIGPIYRFGQENIDPILEDYVYGKRLGGKEKSIVEAIAGPKGKELLKERQKRIDQEKIGEALDKEASLENIEDTTTKTEEPEKKKGFFSSLFSSDEKKEEDKKDDDKKDAPKTTSLADISNRIANLQNQRTTSLEQDIVNLQDQLTKDKNVDKYLALARAGLALTDPSKTVSEALTTGLDAFTDANKRYREGIVDLINARSKLAKSKSGLTINELFNQLAKNRRDYAALVINKGDPDADKLLKQLEDEADEFRRLIANNPGYSQFGINVGKQKEKLAEQTKS